MLAGRQRILFFSAPIGAGHTRAAQAVRAAMLRHNSDLEIKITNVFDFFSPLLGRFILKTYLLILELIPPAYGLMYQWGNKDYSASLINTVVNRFLAHKMYNFIQEYQPAAIVCTHATPAGLAAYLVEHYGLSIPVTAVITDYAAHRLWAYPEVGCYFVAHAGVMEELCQYDIPAARIQLVGIPVEADFAKEYDRHKLLTDMVLDPDKKTLLIMGGGAGVFPMEEVVQLCDAMQEPVQLIVVAGKNRAMYRKLQAIKTSAQCQVRVLGYVGNVHELMAAADMLLSKPGGLTATEALCAALPMIIYKPIPGQEEANTQYLVGNGVAVRADSLDEVQGYIKEFLQEPARLTAMQQRAMCMRKPQAAEAITNTIFSQINS